MEYNGTHPRRRRRVYVRPFPRRDNGRCQIPGRGIYSCSVRKSCTAAIGTNVDAGGVLSGRGWGWGSDLWPWQRSVWVVVIVEPTSVVAVFVNE